MVLFQLLGHPRGDALFVAEDNRSLHLRQRCRRRRCRRRGCDRRCHRAPIARPEQQRQHGVELVALGPVAETRHHTLLDGGVGRPHAPHRHRRERRPEVRPAGNGLQRRRERRREQQRLSPVPRRQVATFHDLSKLWLEAHVHHTVGLVQHEELAARQAQQRRRARQEVHQPPRSGNYDLHPCGERLDLRAGGGAAVDCRRPAAVRAPRVGGHPPRAERELLNFELDLQRELARGGQDERRGPAGRRRVRDVRVGRILAAVDDGRDEGQQKRHGLA
mmetsp:Transcript_24161/g.59957  ORF Transcript_24161/g.59957 Transcript_24161/m.59957 type:complete len:276 (-) Transcript_24161:735-1562(-)